MIFARRWLPLSLVVLLLGSSAASAQSTRTVLVHRVVILGADVSEPTTYDAQLKLVVADTPWKMAQDDAVLTRFSDRTCTGDDSCLGSLAKTAGAEATLLVSLSLAGPRVTVAGRLVSANGRVVRSVSARKFEKAGRELDAVVSEAFRAIVPDLLTEEESVDLVPLVTKTDPATSKTPPSAPPKSTFSARPLGLVIGGVGVASLAGSGVVALLSLGDRRELESRLNDQRHRMETDVEARELALSLRTRSQIATWTLVGGAALTTAGAAIYFLSPAPSKPAVTVGPGPTAAGASIIGSF